MPDNEFLPKIVPLLDMKVDSLNHDLYADVIRNILRKMLGRHG